MSIYGVWQEVFSLDADVWVPLGENPSVLLKHPPVPSGHTKLKFQQWHPCVLHFHLFNAAIVGCGVIQ